MLINVFLLLSVVLGQVSSQEECQDQLGIVECRLLSFQGACQTRRAEMVLTCPKTCNLCSSQNTLPCHDVSTQGCTSYVLLGLCEQLKETLQNTCRLSCGWCTAGNWGVWGSWSRCTTTCGTGSQIRKRTCRSNDCGIGRKQEARQCNVQSCNPERYSTWTQWSGCSLTCGNGVRVRTRECRNSFNVLLLSQCSLRLRQEKSCLIRNCPVYSWLSWSNWESCTKSCARGVQARRRNCNTGPTTNCGSVYVENQFCNDFPCPLVYTWSPWSPWGTCSSSCGPGVTSRSRSCSIGATNSCGSDWREDKICNEAACTSAVYRWLPWSQWTACSLPCGQGVTSRSRSCNIGETTNCGTNWQESKFCNDFQCDPGAPFWRSWSSWTACSQSCDSGYSYRTRTCSGESGSCGEDWIETVHCNQFPCIDILPAWSQWSEWGNCDQPCGTGFRFRIRSCNTGNDADCGSNKRDTQICNIHDCPEVQWNSWRNWGSCTHPCGGGTRSRSRICSSRRIQDCGSRDAESENCNMHDCPAITWTTWGQWTTCTRSCGDEGKKTRRRFCNTGRSSDCGEKSSETWACNTQTCPFNYVWNDWAQWSDCTKPCGSGTRTRTRSCPTGRRSDCGIQWRQIWKCNTHQCRVGRWNAWNGWTACTKSCGSGSRTRTRSCSTGRNSDCGETSKETIECNKQACPAWNRWREWSPCSTTCGPGERKRTRVCNTGRSQDCPGSRTNVANCNIRPCPVALWTEWSPWSLCTRTCETGQKTRLRSCSTGNIADCGPDRSQESLPCNTQTCPPVYFWGPWTFWSVCSEPCGGGIQSRSRSCNSGIDLDCGQSSRETLPCNSNPCPRVVSWGEWNPWSACTATCGVSSRTRLRSCSSGNVDDCGVDSVEIASCEVDPCPQGWSSWSVWSQCGVTCGNATVHRLRSCLGGDCEGGDVQSATCVAQPCPPPCICECSDTAGASCEDFVPYCEQVPAYAEEYCPETCGLCPECLCQVCNVGEVFRRNSTDCCVVNENVTCGQNLHDGQIIGGAQGNQTTWPWMVSLQSGVLACTGALIHKQWIISAAHCFDPLVLDNITATLGGHYTSTGNYSHTYRIRNVITHPRYKLNLLGGSIEHDIALLQLPQEVEINSHIFPICLSWNVVSVGQTCFVANWNQGDPTFIEETPLFVMEEEQCSQFYPQVGSDVVCAGSNDSAANACVANSGGPLMCQMCESCAYYVTGITSFWPSDCEAVGRPVVFTRVSSYWSWVQAIVGFSISGTVSDICK